MTVHLTYLNWVVYTRNPLIPGQGSFCTNQWPIGSSCPKGWLKKSLILSLNSIGKSIITN